MSLLFGLISSFCIFTPFGRPRSITITEKLSLNIFTNIITDIVSSTLISMHFGIHIIKIVSLKICSLIFDKIYGSILCLPQKYPLIILERPINGSVKPIHIIG